MTDEPAGADRVIPESFSPEEVSIVFSVDFTTILVNELSASTVNTPFSSVWNDASLLSLTYPNNIILKTNYDVGTAITSAEMSIDGKIGIGTSNPQAGLHIDKASMISLGPYGYYIQGDGAVTPGTSTKKYT